MDDTGAKSQQRVLYRRIQMAARRCPACSKTTSKNHFEWTELNTGEQEAVSAPERLLFAFQSSRRYFLPTTINYETTLSDYEPCHPRRSHQTDDNTQVQFRAHTVHYQIRPEPIYAEAQPNPRTNTLSTPL
jgi:hypothetical protein